MRQWFDRIYYCNGDDGDDGDDDDGGGGGGGGGGGDDDDIRHIILPKASSVATLVRLFLSEVLESHLQTTKCLFTKPDHGKNHKSEAVWLKQASSCCNIIRSHVPCHSWPPGKEYRAILSGNISAL
jgi:hypothetical protein